MLILRIFAAWALMDLIICALWSRRYWGVA